MPMLGAFVWSEASIITMPFTGSGAKRTTAKLGRCVSPVNVDPPKFAMALLVNQDLRGAALRKQAGSRTKVLPDCLLNGED